MNQIIEYQGQSVIDDKTTARSVALSSGLRVEEQHSPDYTFKGYLITNDIPANDLNAAYEALKASLIPAEDELIARASSRHSLKGSRIIPRMPSWRASESIQMTTSGFPPGQNYRTMWSSDVNAE